MTKFVSFKIKVQNILRAQVGSENYQLIKKKRKEKKKK